MDSEVVINDRAAKRAALYKAYDDIFLHFQQRLNERYGMDITRQQYNVLCSSPFIPFKISKKQDTNVGVVGFSGKLILVVKSKRGKFVLNTALPPSGIRLTLLVKDKPNNK